MAANMAVKLIGDIHLFLDQFTSAIQQELLLSGTAAMAKVIYDEVKWQASAQMQSGTLYHAIYRTYAKEKSSRSHVTYRISWNKKKAPHGHLIEFGTSKAPAYPFIRTAFARVPEAMVAGRKRMAERMATIQRQS